MDANSEAVKIAKPDTDGFCDGVTGPTTIPVGGTGNYTEDFPNWVAVPEETGSGTFSGSGTSADEDAPVPRDIWGPKAGSWYLHNDSFGFRIIGGFDNDRLIVFVRREPNADDANGSGSGSGGTNYEVTCDGDGGVTVVRV